jgi:hypothetical protein
VRAALGGAGDTPAPASKIFEFNYDLSIKVGQTQNLELKSAA